MDYNDLAAGCFGRRRRQDLFCLLFSLILANSVEPLVGGRDVSASHVGEQIVLAGDGGKGQFGRGFVHDKCRKHNVVLNDFYCVRGGRRGS